MFSGVVLIRYNNEMEQIWEIILNTKQEAENIASIAGGTSDKMMVLNQDISGITDSASMVMDQTVKAGKLTRNMNGSEENSNDNSEAVMKQMEQLFRLSGLLNQTVASFKI